jgi:hypothetical protein
VPTAPSSSRACASCWSSRFRSLYKGGPAIKSAVAALVAVLCLVLPGAASAGTASLELERTDLGPGVPRENLNYRADRGEANRVTVRFDGSNSFTVTDTAGVTAGRQCQAQSATRAVCTQSPSGSTLGTVIVRLGDRNDRASLAGHGGLVLGQSGSDVLRGSGFRDTLSAGSSATRTARARTRDRISGRGGGDFLYGSAGPNRIDGGEGFDTISAGRGGDRIRARDRRIDQVRCGGGADRAQLDTADFLADRCRSVSRPGTPAATPVDLFTSGSNAFVTVGCPRDALVERCVGSVSLRRGGS